MTSGVDISHLLLQTISHYLSIFTFAIEVFRKDVVLSFLLTWLFTYKLIEFKRNEEELKDNFDQALPDDFPF